MMIALIVGAVLIVLTVIYWLRDSEKVVVDEAMRQAGSGPAVHVSGGWTQYELSGPSDGPLVILLSSTSLQQYLWTPTVPTLTKAGYRVLRYDLCK